MANAFYINPMSYSNLAVYDYNLLSNIVLNDGHIYYIGNELYDAKQFNDEKITFLPYFSYSNKKSVAKVLSYMFSLLKIARLLSKVKPDVVHIQWIRLWQVDYLFLKYILGKGINVVYTAHNFLPHVQKKKDRLHYKKYYELVGHIIVHSNNTKKQLMDEFHILESKVSVIPHGMLDLSQSLNKEKVKRLKSDLIRKYELKDKVVFAALGMQDYYKGSDLILNTWSNAMGNEKDAFLFVCGKCSDRVKDVVEATGVEAMSNVYLELDKIGSEFFLALLQVSDVLLLPYRAISQSGVLLSAINERLPFIVSNAGGLSDPLKIADVGWMINEVTELSLEKAMKFVLKNRDELEKKKYTPDWFVLQDFYSWGKIGIETGRLYDRMLKR